MKKTILLILGFLLLAGLAGAESIGFIVAVEGKASATDTAGIVRELAVKSEIMLNDTVKTGKKSRVQILLKDDTILSVGESGEMIIDEYVYDPAKPSDNAFGVKLGKGVFRTVTGAITDLNPDRFKVKTRLATIGIRGCDLGFDTTAESEDTVSVMAIPKGKQVIITANLSGKMLTIEEPTFVTITDRGIILQRDVTPADRSTARVDTTPQEGSTTDDRGINAQHKDDPQDVSPEEDGLQLPDSGSLTQSDFKPFTDNTVIPGTEPSHSHSYP